MALEHLSNYGTSFQIKVISALLQPKASDFQISLIDRVIDYLDPDYFESEPNRVLVKIIKNYYEKYKKSPKVEDFVIEIKKSNLDDILRQAVVENYKQALEYLKKGDFEYVEAEFQDFCKTRSLINAIFKSVDYINGGQLDLVKPLIDDALKISTIENFGTKYTTSVEERLTNTDRDNLCATPWAALNEVIAGGLGAGDLGCVIAPSGAGKSWVLSALGMQALKLGKNVLHVTLELGEKYVHNRYDSILTGIKIDDLKYHEEELKDKIYSEIKGELITKYFPTKSLTVQQLRSFLNSLLSINFKPDLLVLDYADLLSPEIHGKRITSSYEDGGNIYEYLRGLGGEFGIPIWTASQANRGGEKNKILTNSDVADSYKKIFTSDCVLTLSRNIDDKAAKIARMFLSKNRYGPDGILFPAKMDVDHGIIDLFAEESVAGKAIIKESKRTEGHAEKRMLKDVNEEVKKEKLKLSKMDDEFMNDLNNTDIEIVPKVLDEYDDFIEKRKKSSDEFELDW